MGLSPEDTFYLQSFMIDRGLWISLLFSFLIMKIKMTFDWDLL